MAAPAPARASGNASVEITGAAACSYIVNTNNQQNALHFSTMSS